MERILTQETLKQEGKQVVLKGWVHSRRDMGKVVFLDIRDRSGIMQVVCVPGELDAASQEALPAIRDEWVIAVTGEVKRRGGKQINKNLPTGTIEVLAKKIEVMNACQALPFEISKDTGAINEETRLKYRYLDLRTERAQRNLRLRSSFVEGCRRYLFDNDFVEIETPLLSKATPEGSRDFVVPSRLKPGKFFALPQSPQQYKQLLMVAGFERYFQIARCLRDEDLRADRGFEHTQVDIEMSFVEREDLLNMIEAMMIAVVEQLGFTIKQKPFPRMTYQEALATYGVDKFDMRTDQEKNDPAVLAYAWVIDFPFFEKTDEGGWTFTHNPFSMPKPEHLDWLMKGEHIPDILTSQYDLVCNGYEIGGGSIRAHKPEILRATFRVLGYSDKEIDEQFGHMITAFNYGAPPHGGIAHGVERLVMILANEIYLREVQAFPQTSSGHTSVMDAPSDLRKDQLEELGIQIRPAKKK